jgi:hypothetical protein
MRQLLLIFAVAACGGVQQQQTTVSCSSTRGSVNQTCDATYDCFDSGTMKNERHEVQCSRPGTTGDFMCDCIDNGVKVRSFVSVDFCNSSDHKAAAQTGCGWRLE